MILLDKTELERLLSLLQDALDNEECYASEIEYSNKDMDGKKGCFHCQVTAMIDSIYEKIAEYTSKCALPIPDNDYVLSEGGAWVEYKNVVLRISSDKIGVSVNMCHKGDEEDMHNTPIAQAFGCFQE
jgi:hypothetical protein